MENTKNWKTCTGLLGKYWKSRNINTIKKMSNSEIEYLAKAVTKKERCRRDNYIMMNYRSAANDDKYDKCNSCTKFLLDNMDIFHNDFELYIKLEKLFKLGDCEKWYGEFPNSSEYIESKKLEENSKKTESKDHETIETNNDSNLINKNIKSKGSEDINIQDEEDELDDSCLDEEDDNYDVCPICHRSSTTYTKNGTIYKKKISGITGEEWYEPVDYSTTTVYRNF